MEDKELRLECLRLAVQSQTDRTVGNICAAADQLFKWALKKPAKRTSSKKPR